MKAVWGTYWAVCGALFPNHRFPDMTRTCMHAKEYGIFFNAFEIIGNLMNIPNTIITD